MNVILKIKELLTLNSIRLRKAASGVESKGSSKGGGREEQMRVQDKVLLTTAAAWNLECLGALVRLRQDTPGMASVDALPHISGAVLHLEHRS
jgi:hypothetical protein